jgi:hypothetical protein
MLRKEKIQVWANVLKVVDERLEALREVDPVLYSKSRVISACVDAYLPTVEAKAHAFQVPSHDKPRRMKRP